MSKPHTNKIGESVFRWYQRRALSAVMAAVKSGELEAIGQLKCQDCDKLAEVYDHRDYSQPLEVVPVCRSCNMKRGPAALDPEVVLLDLTRARIALWLLDTLDSQAVTVSEILKDTVRQYREMMSLRVGL